MSHCLSPSRCLGDLERIPLASFASGFAARRRPAIVTGVADAWPARERWTHAELRSRLGDDVVGRSLPLSPELLADVAFPALPRIHERASVWVLPDGYVSELHFDLPHNLNTVLRGEKDFILFSPEETKNLYPHSPFGRESAQNSRVRLDHVAPEFSRVAAARFWRTTVRAGETIYIPPQFWHFVRSRGESVAVNLWFYLDEPRLLRLARWPRAVLAGAALAKIRRIARFA